MLKKEAMGDSINRLKKVAKVFSKHGLSSVLVGMGLSYLVPFLKRGAKKTPQNLPTRLRDAFAELGGAWIKLGQMLSIRPDLVPDECCKAFKTLQDSAEPVSADEIKKTIEEELKKPIERAFSHFDPRPLGSASVAQVHKARLISGESCAVKVQRPRAAQTFAEDIAMIRLLARKLEQYLPDIRPLEILEEFERYTQNELNFIKEAGHIDAIFNSTKKKKVVIPKVFWNETTKRVLTMQFIDGVKLSQAREVSDPKMSKILVDAVFDQIFNAGIFHADLHPGNIILMPEGKMGLIDFGIIGHIDSRTQELGLEEVAAVLSNDAEKIAEVLLKYGEPDKRMDVYAFKRAVCDKLNEWYDLRPELRRYSQLMQDLFILSARCGLRFPRDCVLLGKALVTAESTARLLDRDFTFENYVKPRVENLLKKRAEPKRVLSKLKEQSSQTARAIAKLPQKTLEAVDNISKGRLSISLSDENFRHVGSDLNKSSNRLSFALMSASLVIASSMLIETGPKIGAYGALSIVGFSLATLFALALLTSVFREGKRPFDKHDDSV
ncbi:AarF/ABC1/UbiB kinase family protein [Candidatus Woesearchaeota archaeon]|nr:MAG: AarF/ABC1/UbiB kinase family protein [Candidatus Woesearchaeota archaeon]